jgi:hypothetical protein
MRRFLWALCGVLFGIILIPIIGPLLMRVGRPFAKSATKAGLIAYRSGREKLALLKENMEDILAETRSEL